MGASARVPENLSCVPRLLVARKHPAECERLRVHRLWHGVRQSTLQPRTAQAPHLPRRKDPRLRSLRQTSAGADRTAATNGPTGQADVQVQAAGSQREVPVVPKSVRRGTLAGEGRRRDCRGRVLPQSPEATLVVEGIWQGVTSRSRLWGERLFLHGCASAADRSPFGAFGGWGFCQVPFAL